MQSSKLENIYSFQSRNGNRVSWVTNTLIQKSLHGIGPHEMRQILSNRWQRTSFLALYLGPKRASVCTCTLIGVAWQWRSFEGGACPCSCDSVKWSRGDNGGISCLSWLYPGQPSQPVALFGWTATDCSAGFSQGLAQSPPNTLHPTIFHLESSLFFLRRIVMDCSSHVPLDQSFVVPCVSKPRTVQSIGLLLDTHLFWG